MDSNLLQMITWPLDGGLLLRKRKSIRRQLLEEERTWTDVKIAILGASTTDDIRDFMEIFLLAEGIRPAFYMSEYGRYWEDGVFGNAELEAFQPQIVYIHSTSRAITRWPDLDMDENAVNELLDTQFEHFQKIWDSVSEKYGCTIIQNNFERPVFRILGNSEISDIHGYAGFVFRLNAKLYEYARAHKHFYVHDVDYLAADYGLSKWHDLQAWNLYKSACALQAGPEFAYNLTRIIKSVYGKNKKALALDLDNTLWGGVVGDDGVNALEMGSETAKGEGFRTFQQYLKSVKQLGILLTVDSKNDSENAIAGLEHPDCLLRPDDFVLIKANWNTKEQNLVELADEISIGTDSFVFMDDNPTERYIVKSQLPEVTVPDFTSPDECIKILNHAGYFEVCEISADDRARNQMYQANISRKKQEQKFANYEDYLRSLEMRATIKAFEPVFIPRIAQLTNKTNQFNLTTRRYSESDITNCSNDDSYVCLYGRLEDKFGDNGIVSVVMGKIKDNALHMELWLMSCRVLKKDMEKAMFDALVEECGKRGIATIVGYYYPTAKNGMVKDFYKELGFANTSCDENGNTVWQYATRDHVKQNQVISEIIRE